MSVRKVFWGQAKEKEGWMSDYVDGEGKRRSKTFAKKSEADAHQLTAKTEVKQGTHTPESKSPTVAVAGKSWLEACKGRMERSTYVEYARHLEQHIVPYIGGMKVAKLTRGNVKDLEDKLTAAVTASHARRVRASLGLILADAQDRGALVRNVVHEMKGSASKQLKAERRARGNLKVGVDIPAPEEIKRILAALKGRWRPLIMTAIFTGLRSSELRGLRWSDVDLAKTELHVRQRADRYHAIGRPKSAAGERDVPLPPMLVKVLREWKLACRKGPLDLCFPNTRGKVESHSNIIVRAVRPTMIAAGLKDDTGGAKYSGLHAFRHFYASWCINRAADGGLELPAKVVQTRLGHANISITLDRYGHLFPTGDDGGAMADAERKLMGLH
jgi:integrase